MQIRLTVFSVAFLSFFFAGSSFAVSDSCKTSEEILRLEERLTSGSNPGPRSTLVNCLRTLRGAELDVADKKREERIGLLERLAKEDLQRLTQRLDLLTKLQANGRDRTIDKAQESTEASLSTLASVAHIVDGKPELVSNLFTTDREDKKKANDKTKADTAEQNAKDACKTDGAALSIDTPAQVKRCLTVLKDAIEANTVAQERAGGWTRSRLEAELARLTRIVERIEERATAMPALEQKAADEIQKQIDAEKDADKKKALEQKLADLKTEMKELDDSAVQPALRRRCIVSPATVASLKEAPDVERCINALINAIEKQRLIAESAESTVARDRAGQLTVQLARIEDEMRLLKQARHELNDSEGTRRAAEKAVGPGAGDEVLLKAQQEVQQHQSVKLVSAARSICDDGTDDYILLSRPRVVEHCIDGIRAALAEAESETNACNLRTSVARAEQARLEQELVNAQKRGADLMEQLAKTSQKQQAAIDAAADADKEKLKKDKKATDDQISLLADIAFDPTAARSCQSEFAHLAITGGGYVVRCIHALTARVQEARECPNPAQRKKEVARYEFRLARFEEAGRRLASTDKETIAANKALRDATGVSADEKTKLQKKIDEAQNDLDNLRKVVIVPGEDPQDEFADYEQWFSKFGAGYEYAGASDAFGKGFARIGMTIGFHYKRNEVPEESANWHPWAYGFYELFSISLTNAGEAQPTPLPGPFQTAAAKTSVPHALDEEPGTTTSGSDTSTQIRRALEFEFQTFNPWWRNDYQAENPRLRTRIGPVLILGGRKLDSDSFLHYRAYLGIRNARSAETYWDILYGHTGGLHSHRLEVRGQYALPHEFKNGGRLSIGAVGNFGANKRKFVDCEEGSSHCHAEEKDIVKFYINYDIDGPGFLSYFGLDKKADAK